MIRSVTITNPKNEALVLELTNPEKSGLMVSKIEGLGSPKASINGQEMATDDGMIYSSARANTRNIIFTLYMMERNALSPFGPLTIEQSRRLTYRYFPLKKKIRITVSTDDQTLYCEGYVESNEPSIFEEREFTTISVICPDPYFYTDNVSQTIFSGIRPEFEFPFSNESLTKPLIEVSSIWIDKHAILDYTGTVDTGVVITVHSLSGPAENIRLYNVDTTERIYIDTNRLQSITGSAFGLADDIIISTVRGDRYCQLLRNGKYTNIIGCLSRDSDWFQLSAGANGFAFTADKGADNLSVTFSFRNAYVGV